MPKRKITQKEKKVKSSAGSFFSGLFCCSRGEGLPQDLAREVIDDEQAFLDWQDRNDAEAKQLMRRIT